MGNSQPTGSVDVSPTSVTTMQGVRYAPGLAVLFCAAHPAIGVSSRLADGNLRDAGILSLIHVAYLPGFLYLVHRAATGGAMRYRRWTLATTALGVVAAMPIQGEHPVLVALVVAAFLALPLRWAFAVAAVAIPLRGAWLVVDEGVAWSIWLTVSAVWTAAAVYSVVWLVGVMRTLRLSRAALVETVLRAERAERDTELRETLGTAMESIVIRSEEARTKLHAGSPEAADNVEELVDLSRTTLADARRMISSLHRTSVRHEVDTAMALLEAAGVTTTVAHSTVGQHDDEHARQALRSGVADLLIAPPGPDEVVTIEGGDGGVSVTNREVRAAP